MTFKAFELDITDGVARVTLNQPERGNPFDLDFCTELSLVATECDENPAVRAVLIDARGRFFSVGADLHTMGADRAGLSIFIKNATTGLHSAISRFTRMDAPVIVAVHAMAVGGSVALSAAADFCLAARSASFYAAYCGIGLVPDAGGSTFLPRRVGGRRATEFFLRNQRWTAEQAYEYGLVNEVVPEKELADRAWALAVELAAGPTKTFGEVKNLLLSMWEQPIEAQMEREARAMGRVVRTEDSWNAIQTMIAKGKPVFRGE